MTLVGGRCEIEIPSVQFLALFYDQVLETDIHVCLLLLCLGGSNAL